MVGFDDAAMMGLGAINAGVQIYGQQLQKRGQKKLDKISRAQKQRNYEADLRDIDLQKDDVNRQAYYQQSENKQEIGDRQGPGSSYERHVSDRLEGERSRRYDALSRQKSMMQADWLDEQRAYKIQRKMQKNAQTMSMISSMLLQGGAGVGGMMGGSTMAGG